jgi:hypothetical protein
LAATVTADTRNCVGHIAEHGQLRVDGEAMRAVEERMISLCQHYVAEALKNPRPYSRVKTCDLPAG